MITAKHLALRHNISVQIYTTNYPSDDPFIAEYIENKEFIALPYLNRSVKSEADKLMEQYIYSNHNCKHDKK